MKDPESEKRNGNETQTARTKTWEEIDMEIGKLAANGAFSPQARIIINPVTITESSKLGPKSLDQWKCYETELLDRIVRVIEGSEKPDWSTLFFKKESDFVSGIWNHNKNVWRILIAYMPENEQALAYHLIMKGADLFLNLDDIPSKDTVQFKRKTICTKPKKHESNAKLFKLLPGNDRTWTNRRLRLAKFVPKPFEVLGKKIRPLSLPNNEAVRERADKITEQIRTWCKMGSVSLWTGKGKPWLTTGFILVDRPEKETRICLNGSIMKPLEKYTFPCKLDSVGSAIQTLRKGDLLMKFDDRKGKNETYETSL